MIDFRNKLREALEVYATEIDEYLKSLKGEKYPGRCKESTG